ncbi:MAG: FkbM family methyltransferase [Deltaproteobacteria bacterium]|nr:MAG: FkbM family methyltransferase [Deltaproteobacteria bacterium]
MWEAVRQPSIPGAVEAGNFLQNLAKEKVMCGPRQVDKPMILYGAGNLGEMAKDFFARLGIPFLYVVDAQADRYHGSKTWQGIAVVKPAEVPQEHRRGYLLAICISSAPFSSIAAPLEKQGWRDMVPFYDIAETYIDRCPLSNGWFSGTLSDEDLAGIEYVLHHWHDDVSRAHHLQFLAWHGLRRDWIFDAAPVTVADRFFIPQVLSSLHEKEVLVDAGAHHGAVSLKFMELAPHKFQRIYAIEPDKYNLQVLRANLGGRNGAKSPDIRILDCALGKAPGSTPFFHGLNYASQFSPMAKESVQVKTLDELDLPATLIKLHLEGWEDDALLGSWHNLNKYRPLLMVTTYHKRNGLWQLPLRLMKNLQDYAFLLRLHGWMGTGSVLYAIPRERSLS